MHACLYIMYNTVRRCRFTTELSCLQTVIIIIVENAKINYVIVKVIFVLFFKELHNQPATKAEAEKQAS